MYAAPKRRKHEMTASFEKKPPLYTRIKLSRTFELR